MVIPYRTVKCKSTNIILAIAILGSTTKFNSANISGYTVSCNYAWLCCCVVHAHRVHEYICSREQWWIRGNTGGQCPPLPLQAIAAIRRDGLSIWGYIWPNYCAHVSHALIFVLPPSSTPGSNPGELWFYLAFTPQIENMTFTVILQGTGYSPTADR